MSKFEKIFYTALAILTIFMIGVQIGIHHGRKLQIEEGWRQERMQEYIFKQLTECEQL
jgi:hypothetical protein